MRLRVHPKFPDLVFISRIWKDRGWVRGVSLMDPIR